MGASLYRKPWFSECRSDLRKRSKSDERTDKFSFWAIRSWAISGKSKAKNSSNAVFFNTNFDQIWSYGVQKYRKFYADFESGKIIVEKWAKTPFFAKLSLKKISSLKNLVFRAIFLNHFSRFEISIQFWIFWYPIWYYFLKTTVFLRTFYLCFLSHFCLRIWNHHKFAFFGTQDDLLEEKSFPNILFVYFKVLYYSFLWFCLGREGGREMPIFFL